MFAGVKRNVIHSREIPDCATNFRRPDRFLARRRATAFSLIELLIVLALIIVLTVMMWGFGSQPHQEKQKIACQKNLQKIFVAMQIYANDSKGSFPIVTNAQTSEEPLSLLVPRYTSDTASFICPGSKDSPLPSGEPFATRRISYAYFMGRRATDTSELLLTDRQIDTGAKRAKQQIFSLTGKKPGNNHHKYGGNYLFCDGRIEAGSALAPFFITVTQGVSLLNPKP